MSSNYSEDSTHAVIKYGLSRFLPMRIILKKTDEGYEGYCEDSFSMSFYKQRVRIWWSGTAYSMLGEHTLDGIKDATHHLKDGEMMFDPLSDDCPVEIDWERWRNAERKFDSRNAHFREKTK
jgi:hypothetical protein